MAMLQKVLLRLRPEAYPGVKPSQIKYAHVSRRIIIEQMMITEFRQKYLQYLEQLGVTAAQRLLLTDMVCMGGSLHSGIRALFPDKEVEGCYMYSPKDQPATVGDDVHSFLNEVLGVKPYEVHFEFDNMLLLFEALFSGPFESTREFEWRRQTVVPHLDRKRPGDVAQSRGLSANSILMLNRVAVQGLRDATALMHRCNLLGQFRTHIDIMKQFYRFISSAPSPMWRDIWLSVTWCDRDAYVLAEHNPVELILGGIAAGKI